MKWKVNFAMRNTASEALRSKSLSKEETLVSFPFFAFFCDIISPPFYIHRLTMPDKREEEPSQHTNHENIEPDSPLNRLLQGWGLFDNHTPQGKDPTIYPIQVIDLKNYQTDMQVYRTPHADPALSQAWPTWSESIKKILMAYEVTVFPLLQNAEKEFAKTPHDPSEHGPASYQSAITEAIRDAQANPGKNTQEFPHRAPITLTDEEFAILLKITKARNLPSPGKRIFSYTEHVPLLDARSEALRKSPAYLAIQEKHDTRGDTQAPHANPGRNTQKTSSLHIRLP